MKRALRKPPVGWICPRCQAGLAPTEKRCNCNGTVTVNDFPFQDVAPFRLQERLQDGYEPVGRETFPTLDAAKQAARRRYRGPLGQCSMIYIHNGIGQSVHYPLRRKS